MESQAVIVSEGLTRKFKKTTAVDGLSLTVNAGEVFGLLGHNGAGKTTTVRLMNGILTPTSGSVRVFGFSPTEQGSAVRQRTGVLTETPSLYETLNAHDNLRLFADLYNLPRDQVGKRIDETLTRFDLADRAKEKVGGYSKGMKQRLALARAFLHQPELLFLDEPTAGLDPVAAKSVNDQIIHLSRNEGKTVVLATHNLVDAQRLCDRVAILEKGRVVALGTPRDLARQIRWNVALEIEVDPAQVDQAKAALVGYTVARKRDTLIVSGITHEQIPDLLAAVVRAGVRIYRCEPDEPTLEDVYFAIQQEGRA